MNDLVEGFVFRVRSWLTDADGNDYDLREDENLITNVGLRHFADQMGQDTETHMNRMAVGTGTGQSKTSTTLATEIARVTLESGWPKRQSSPTDNVTEYKAVFAAGTGTGSLTEGCIINAASGGQMLNYWEWNPARIKDSTASLTVIYTIQIGSLS